ncbi:MAG: hypothetical protein MJ252_30375, partial [archaeon]|nr:hypothetical protein [archaeon]
MNSTKNTFINKSKEKNIKRNINNDLCKSQTKKSRNPKNEIIRDSTANKSEDKSKLLYSDFYINYKKLLQKPLDKRKDSKSISKSKSKTKSKNEGVIKKFMVYEEKEKEKQKYSKKPSSAIKNQEAEKSPYNYFKSSKGIAEHLVNLKKINCTNNINYINLNEDQSLSHTDRKISQKHNKQKSTDVNIFKGTGYSTKRMDNQNSNRKEEGEKKAYKVIKLDNIIKKQIKKNTCQSVDNKYKNEDLNEEGYSTKIGIKSRNKGTVIKRDEFTYRNDIDKVKKLINIDNFKDKFSSTMLRKDFNKRETGEENTLSNLRYADIYLRRNKNKG